MYLKERTDDQIGQYTDFFESNWKLLEQALIELGSDPDNQKLRARVRSITTILQLTAVTIDHLEDRQAKVVSVQPVYLGELSSVYASA